MRHDTVPDVLLCYIYCLESKELITKPKLFNRIIARYILGS